MKETRALPRQAWDERQENSMRARSAQPTSPTQSNAVIRRVAAELIITHADER